MNDFDFETMDQSANMTAVAEPSAAAVEENAAAGDIGAEAQEVTDPADSGEAADPGEAPRAQSKEENARYAAIRRRAEQEKNAAIAEAKADSERQIMDVLRAAGVRDPRTGGAIENTEGLKAWQQHQADLKKREAMTRLGMDEASYDSFVSSLPEVQAARQREEQAAAAEQESRQRQASEAIKEQLREIGKMDPTIKSMADLVKSESYDQIYGMVKRGYSIADAYKLANMDKLTAQGSERARQAAMNAQAGKAHLSATTQRGGGDAPVPADVKEMYRSLMPELSDAEIAREYNRQLKK